jgi:hypothetical protein
MGAILVFLPGWDEIMRLKELLESSPHFGDASRHLLLPLHSLVAPAEQRRVFLRPPLGVRKIVMATNIAGGWRRGRCGVVWCGVVWCGVVWCGVVWCGVVWCGVVWCGVDPHVVLNAYLPISAEFCASMLAACELYHPANTLPRT